MLGVKTGKEVYLKPEIMERIQCIIEQYPEGKSKSAILPILHIVQEENAGWLSVEAMDLVAKILKIKPIEVYEVATFYSMYNLKPVGKYVLEVCQTGPCCLNGAEWLIGYLEKKLRIKVGETTKDNMFTLKTVECLGACGYAPMMQVGENFHEFLTSEDKVDDLLNNFITKAAQSN